MSAHPSHLELYRLRLAAALPETLAHVAACGSCREQLTILQAPPAVPGWVAALPVSRPWPWQGFLLAAAMTSLAIAVGLNLSKTRPAIEPLLFASKGVPSVAVYVKRGDEVRLWDGKAPVRPGDRLRLEISAAGLRYVTVASHADFQSPLYAGELKAMLLPAGWVVDEQPGPESLDIVLSLQLLDERELTTALSSHRRDASVWTTTLSIPKTEVHP